MIPLRPITIFTWHEIARQAGPATAFLASTTSPDAFVRQLDFIQHHYEVIPFDRLLAGDVPRKAALLTIDDAYASTARLAAPLLAARGMPAVLFVNTAPVLDRFIPLDAVASLVASVKGISHLTAVAAHSPERTPTFTNFMNSSVARLGCEARAELKQRLLKDLDADERILHRDLDLYLNPKELVALTAQGIEIANHTRTHVHCGALGQPELDAEICLARDEIQELTGQPVRAFAFPWGRRADATEPAMNTIRRSGHKATFLVHGRNNVSRPADDVWYRVLLRNETGGALTAATAVLPRLREWRSKWTGDEPLPAPQPAL